MFARQIAPQEDPDQDKSTDDRSQQGQQSEDNKSQVDNSVREEGLRQEHDPDIISGSNNTLQNVPDGSFLSFVNSEDSNLNEDEIPLEMLFYNEALLKILGKQTEDDLKVMLDKAVFSNPELSNQLSLKSAIQ